ncbi:hypothetical protein [Providencia rettgeri]|uniref:hypothetical protein n=1 Tax=Providencia rettgeri TaxID=587 RepID=UPI0032DAFD68
MITFKIIQNIDETEIIKYIKNKNITKIEQINIDALIEQVIKNSEITNYYDYETLTEENRTELLEKATELLNDIKNGNITINYKI